MAEPPQKTLFQTGASLKHYKNLRSYKPPAFQSALLSLPFFQGWVQRVSGSLTACGQLQQWLWGFCASLNRQLAAD